MLRSPIPPARRRFRADRRGTSAVEFAIILPIMLVLWAGMAEIGHAVDNWRKVTQLARTVADITSQGDPSGLNPMTPATMNDILASTTAVLRPFSTAKVAIRVSALEIDLVSSPTHPKVCSSVSNNTTLIKARTVGTASDLPIPAGLLQQGQRYILAEVSATYTPMMGGTLAKLIPGINATPTLPASVSWPTRGGLTYNNNAFTEVILPGGAQCP